LGPRVSRKHAFAQSVAALQIAVLALLGAGSIERARAGERAGSEWVSLGPDGRLLDKTTPASDRILDFSSAGYMAGGVALRP
jgi:hypothetical protein